MEDRTRLLPLLGLCLRGNRLAVGEEAAQAACQAMDARLILLSADAAERTERLARRLAEEGRCLWARLPFPKEQLGRALGRGGVALAAVTDTGLARTLAHRLAELDGARYGELASRLDVKAQRAQRRRTEAQERLGAPHREARSRAKPKPEAVRRGAKPQGADGAAGRNRPGKAPAARGARKARPAQGGARQYAHSRPVKKGKGSFRRDGA